MNEYVVDIASADKEPQGLVFIAADLSPGMWAVIIDVLPADQYSEANDPRGDVITRIHFGDLIAHSGAKILRHGAVSLSSRLYHEGALKCLLVKKLTSRETIIIDILQDGEPVVDKPRSIEDRKLNTGRRIKVQTQKEQI